MDLRVLIVEDSEDDLELLLVELRRGGYYPAYHCVATRAEMEQRLMAELKRTGDPRVVEGGKFFESPPMTDPINAGAAAKKRGKGK